MSIGFKIKKLRENKKLSQPELSRILGIAQTTLSNIENGETKKIDFILMDKICNEFDVDFNYFIEPDEINNVQKNDGGVVGRNYGTIYNFPENVLEQIKLLIDDNKKKELLIKELQEKLNSKKN